MTDNPRNPSLRAALTTARATLEVAQGMLDRGEPVTKEWVTRVQNAVADAQNTLERTLEAYEAAIEAAGYDPEAG